jgi:serine/threonine protein kinase
MQLAHRIRLATFSNPDARKACRNGVDIPYCPFFILQIVQSGMFTQGLIHRDLKPLNCFMDESGTVSGRLWLQRQPDKADTSSVTAAFDVDEDHTAGGYAIYALRSK